ncbi:MAG: YraN family protein [Polyangiaceae bacterium]|nr:YraN family protein [Polyangiaceae bacterium]
MGRARARPGARTARRPAGDEPNSDPHVNATQETSPADPRRPAGSAAFRAEVAARKERGARAEAAVAAYLAAQGLEILGMNVRVGRLEIDVVARDGPVIAIVEVRTRGEGSYLRGLDSIDARTRMLVRRAGERLWRARFSRVAGVERMRFDAAAVTFLPDGEAVVEHVKAAL